MAHIKDQKHTCSVRDASLVKKGQDPNNGLKKVFSIFIAIFTAFSAVSLFFIGPSAAEGDSNPADTIFKINFGGEGVDIFENVIEVVGGYIAVGRSDSDSFGSGNWIYVTGKGSDDAVIVKFDTDGSVVWAYNFGGSGYDSFSDVIEVVGGYVAVGSSYIPAPVGDGDWSDCTSRGGTDAVIVKFNDNGSVVWAYNFGGSGYDSFYDVTAADGGFVAVGPSDTASFGNGDWPDSASKGGDDDPVIVKFNDNGSVVWAYNFGGSGYDSFYDVTAADGGFVAVGYSRIPIDGGDYDWSTYAGKGGYDATAVRFNADGDIECMNIFGGSGDDRFFGVTAADGGFVAVGCSVVSLYGDGDWKGNTGKGHYDATIVKFNADGTVAWKKNLGDSSYELFYGVIGVSGGYAAFGSSNDPKYSDLPIDGTKVDATLFEFNTDGDVKWKTVFGGDGGDEFYGMAEAGDGYIAVGLSGSSSFCNEDWPGYTTKGQLDAIIVKFPLKHDVKYHVNGGTGGPADDTNITSGTTHALNGRIIPTHEDVNGKKTLLAGWSLAQTSVISPGDDLPELVTSVKVQNGDVNVYAVWSSDIITVTFAGNGGSGASKDTQGFAGRPYGLPSASDYVRSGYTLIGWSVDNDGSVDAGYGPGDAQIFMHGVNGIYAIWSANPMTVTFNGRGGTASSGVTENASGYTGETYALPSAFDYTRPGYTLDGWSVDNDGSADVGYGPGDSQIFMYGVNEVYAAWIAESSAGGLDGNGDENGSGKDNTVFMAIGAAVIIGAAIFLAIKWKGKDGL